MTTTTVATHTKNNINDINDIASTNDDINDITPTNDAPRILRNTRLGRSRFFTPTGVENKPAKVLGYTLMVGGAIGVGGSVAVLLLLMHKF